MNIVTITDNAFRHLVVRLAASLRRTNPFATLRVFCPDQTVADRLRVCPNIQPELLPEIYTLGVKRAKFLAYQKAASTGPFIYLDADTLVLSDISELTAHQTLAGCPDDLSGCPAIKDRSRPWPEAPDLENRIYINSGVFFAPATWRGRFDELANACLDETIWRRHILPGVLYDNHFLCAWLNRWDEPVAPLDPEVYNWQGLHKHGVVQVFRRDGLLWNKQAPTKRLRIAHFAGVRDIDTFLTTLDPDIGALLARAGTSPEEEPVSVALNGLAGIDAALNSRPEDQHFMHVASAAMNELSAIAKRRCPADWSTSTSYLAAPERWIALASTTRHSNTTWNGLACGGAYLEGDEYAFLRQIVRTINSASVLESGAGETSILFRSLGCTTTAFEYIDGPWRERAEGAGAQVVMTDLSEAGIPEEAMSRAAAVAGPVDLVFIDSPSGGPRRTLVASQILRRLKPRYVIFHDAWRDSSAIASIQESFSLTVLARFPSGRGIIVLGDRNEKPIYIPPSSAPERHLTPKDAEKVSIELLDSPTCLLAGEQSHARVRITNRGAEALSGNWPNPVRIGCHWLALDRSSLDFNGTRTELPCTLLTGDVLETEMRFLTPSMPGKCLLQADLVQEGVLWFSHSLEQPASISSPIEIRG